MKRRPTVEDDDFVRRVDVQDVVERPRAVVAVQGRVRTRVVRLDRRVGESGNKLLDVTHALHAGDRRTKGVFIPENEIHAVRHRV
jgi:hypothetical protein